MSKEIYKSKDSKEAVSKNEVFGAERIDAALAVPIDRSESERGIEMSAESEIETGDRLEEIRKELGLDAGENKEVSIRIEVLLKKMSLPFDDPEIDKKRQELFLRTEEELNKIIEELAKKDNEITGIKGERKSLAEKIEQLKVLKGEKEKEIELLRREAQEYIDKTKPPIIRRSTKERLARAKGIIQYFDKKGTYNPLFEGYDFGGSIDSARSGFDEAQEKDNKIYQADGELDSARIRITSIDELDLGRLEESRMKVSKKIEDRIAGNNDNLNRLVDEQKSLDERKERMLRINEILLTLVPPKKEKSVELSPRIKEQQKTTQERSERNIADLLDGFLRRADFGHLVDRKINNSTEALEKLRKEVKKVQESASVTVNMKEGRLLKILKDGRFKSTLEIPWKEKDKKGAPSVEYYERTRIATEQSLGIHASGTEDDPFAIVGALASDNGYDEFSGAARNYGDVFIKLKSAVLDRSVFINGDTIHEVSRHSDSQIKSGLDKDAAMIAKAIRNIEGDGARTQAGDHTSIIEVDVLGGVKVDEIESINLSSPEKFLEEYNVIYKKIRSASGKERLVLEERAKEKNAQYSERKKLIEKIRTEFPQYVNLINVI